MLPSERRAALSLALVYMFRMVGLFVVLPVLALYADGLRGATPLLLGLAVGTYGLTQAALQIPFGIMSDRWGRKPVIVAGLLVFAVGSAVAATADSIYGVIAGRALQGAGAVASAIMALAADLSRDSQRTKVMAIIGASIGLAFMLSLMLGPVISAWVGVSGLFWLSLVLSLMGAALVWRAVPTPNSLSQSAGFSVNELKRVLLEPSLLALNLSIFCLHGSLMALFVVVPFYLRDQLGLMSEQHWWVYLPVMLVSLLVALPLIMRSGRSGAQAKALRIGVLVVGCGAAVMAAGQWLSVWAGLWLAAFALYFVGFNVLEASLPSLVSRLVPAGHKGAALGAYSTSQFLGTFVGGAVGGWALGALGVAWVIAGIAVMVAIWAVLLWRAPLETPWDSLAVFVASKDAGAAVAAEIQALEGVGEVHWVAVESLLYVRFLPSDISAETIYRKAKEAQAHE
ncbi:major facilitator superfamily MFS_1 [gamma proteobacterium HTCC5015]|nr:major facilitator superfamily MFS_1 [gamma proteobacterium HTCC5015]